MAPLEDPATLEPFDMVVLAGATETRRLDELARAAAGLGTVVLDMAGCGGLLPVSTPVLPPLTGRPDPPVLRVPHPGVVAARAVLDPLADLGIGHATLHVVEPASARGKASVEDLARQAAARLRGEPPGDAGGEPALAFNLVTAAPDRLAAEAVRLLDPVPVAVTRAVDGRFHGHVIHLGVVFEHPVEYDEVEERWADSERLVHSGEALSVDTVPDSHAVHMGMPVLSRDGRGLGVTAAVDGLLVGGALSALELLTALL